MIELLKKISQFNKDDGLSEEEAYLLFSSFVSSNSEITDCQIAAYLFSTSIRELKVSEIKGAIRALREVMTEVVLPDERPVLDTCGTGGSGLDTFSTSTTVSLIAAAAGCLVVKHGNRASSSRTGSADVLEALGVNLELSTEQATELLRRTNYYFAFAPRHHPATKRVAGIRKELGVRTIFNILGPLLSPARAKRQVMGVNKESLLLLYADVYKSLGGEKALIVQGSDGLDELTLTGSSKVVELCGGEVKSFEITPEELGLKRRSLEEIKGALPTEMASYVRGLLGGEKGPYRDLVVLNASAALYVYGLASTLAEGKQLAEKTIDSGAAAALLERVVEISNELAEVDGRGR